MKKGLFLFLLYFLAAQAQVTTGQANTVSARSGWVSLKKPPAAAPVIAWRTPLSTQLIAPIGTYRLTVCIQSASPITRLVLVQNGTEIPGEQRGFKRVACGLEVTKEINLVSGPNELVVKATNEVGVTSSEPRFITGSLSEKFTAAAHPVFQKRLALVIANAAYETSLRNPLNDGRAIKTLLEKLGFGVTYRENLRLKELDTLIDAFITNLGNNNVGLVYYAGHGLMVDGENYLQPVGADLARETDVKYECYPLGKLLEGMGETNSSGANLVFWDACRNNPYRSWYRSAGERVYAPMQPANGTMIIYATRPGKPADDGGDGPNSYFTSELIQHIDQPNVDVYELVDRIDRGLEARGIKQPPYTEGLLRGRFYFKPVP